jgi:Flp pilus assembly protein TadB
MFQGPFWLFCFLSVSSAALFGFLAVATYSESRRQERESYYKSDMLKKIAEMQTSGAAAALEYLRDQQQASLAKQAEQKREGYILGGLITAAVGIGLIFFLHAIVHSMPIYMVGLIPAFIGLAMLVYIYTLAPRR